MIMRRVSFLMMSFLLAFVFCHRPLGGESDKAAFLKRTDHLLIWAHSDIQPRKLSQRADYEGALRDVRANLPPVYMAIVAGDIIQYEHTPEVYEWFLLKRASVKIPYWFEIAGNHDAKDLPRYRKYIRKPMHYSVTLGNILFLFLSDEDRTPPTEISDGAFRWWREMVKKNQHRIIFTVSHACLKRSGLFSAVFSKQVIVNSERFEEVLRKYRVDVWLSGHSHFPGFLSDKTVRSVELGGTLFADISAIRRDVIVPSESRILYLLPGSRYLLMKTRNHTRGTFERSGETFYPLRYPFQWDGSPPVMGEAFRGEE